MELTKLQVFQLSRYKFCIIFTFCVPTLSSFTMPRYKKNLKKDPCTVMYFNFT